MLAGDMMDILNKIRNKYGISSEIIIRDNYKNGLISINTVENIFRDNSKINKNINIRNEKCEISIIIPTYNRINQLVECINSILNQTYNNYEIIIVDDCSKDNTSEIIHKYFQNENIKYIRNNKNSGAGFSRKNGFSESAGNIVIFMDDDDYLIDDDYLKTLVKIFENQDVCMVCSNSYILYENNSLIAFDSLNISNEINSIEYLKEFMTKYRKPNSTFPVAFRKSDLLAQHFEEMVMVNDASIYLRCMLSNKKVMINDKIVGIYRVHDKNISYNIKPDFLIANLNEKLLVYYELKKQVNTFNIDKWINQQIYFTVSYFIHGSHPKYNLFKPVIYWINNNIPFSRYTIIKLYIKYLLVKMKHILDKGEK